MNSFKHKVLFRCDAANIPEIGTGHLYRCLTIALLLKKKYNLKYHDIAFVVKSKNEFEKLQYSNRKLWVERLTFDGFFRTH